MRIRIQVSLPLLVLLGVVLLHACRFTPLTLLAADVAAKEHLNPFDWCPDGGLKADAEPPIPSTPCGPGGTWVDGYAVFEDVQPYPGAPLERWGAWEQTCVWRCQPFERLERCGYMIGGTFQGLTDDAGLWLVADGDGGCTVDPTPPGTSCLLLDDGGCE